MGIGGGAVRRRIREDSLGLRRLVNVAALIDEHRWRLLTWWIILFTVVVIVGIYRDGKLHHDGQIARAALCSFRADLGERIDRDKAGIQTTQDFLRAHPLGVPGFPANTLKISISVRQHTVANEILTFQSLTGLRC